VTTIKNLNLPLLQKALDHIEAHPEEWNQGSWGQTVQGCGTTACLAGHIALLDGWTPVVRPRHIVDEEEPTIAWEGVTKKGARGLPYATWWDNHSTRYTMVSDAAQAALGVTPEEWSDFTFDSDDYLWGGMNDREDLWRIANELADGQLTLPMDLQEKLVAES
jgi:hypothetical protein